MSRIDLLCGTHGNETLGPAVHDLLEAEPIADVRSRIAHPDAVERGVRLLGKTQLMDHYPGDTDSEDPEDKAAADNMGWLGDDAGSDEAVVEDIHNTIIPGVHFCEVGNRALKASIGSALLMGHRKVILSGGLFYKAVPNAAALESPVLSKTGEQLTASLLYQGLRRIAALDIDALREQYENAESRLTFWSKHEIVIEPGSYTSSTTVVNNPDLLQSLESIPNQPAMTELALDTDLRQALGIPSDSRVLVENWGYQNMSVDLPGRGMCNGRRRKLGFGSILVEIEPPIDDGNWLNFKSA